jgi:hypothetical protein
MIAGAAGGRNGLSVIRVPFVYSKPRLLPQLVRVVEDRLETLNFGVLSIVVYA